MASNLLLKIESPTVNGDSTVKGFEQQIECSSYSWGVSMPSALGSSTGGSVGTANFADLSVTKSADSSTADIFAGVVSGTHYGTITLTILAAGGDSPINLMQYVLTNCMFTSFSQSGAGDSGSVPMESLSIGYDQIQVTYVPQSDSGSGDAQKQAGWDVAANQKL